jgi:hypothetical protein
MIGSMFMRVNRRCLTPDGAPRRDAQVREATASGRALGPRILAAGPILDDPPGDWPLRMRVKTAEDGRPLFNCSRAEAWI